jgi:hypothetical protein
MGYGSTLVDHASSSKGLATSWSGSTASWLRCGPSSTDGVVRLVQRGRLRCRSLVTRDVQRSRFPAGEPIFRSCRNHDRRKVKGLYEAGPSGNGRIAPVETVLPHPHPARPQCEPPCRVEAPCVLLRWRGSSEARLRRLRPAPPASSQATCELHARLPPGTERRWPSAPATTSCVPDRRRHK